MSHWRTALAAAVVALLVAVLGCSADEPEVALPPSNDDPSSNEANGGVDNAVLVAASTDDVRVWESPDDDPPPVETLRVGRQVSGEVVSVVVGERGRDWLEVELPTAPAGHTGWIKRADVTLSRHRFRIEVALSDHTLTLHTGEAEALTARVAIGTVDTPEPDTTLFIKDLVKPPNPTGPYSRYAYGLSGTANDLAAFQAGRGVVAIHGVADPSTLGRDVPLGSIAVAPDVMTRMVETYGLPLGTPVDVVE
jgi:lipoprotein-anchoring transpeptidase ErfK/SrfK